MTKRKRSDVGTPDLAEALTPVKDMYPTLVQVCEAVRNDKIDQELKLLAQGVNEARIRECRDRIVEIFRSSAS